MVNSNETLHTFGREEAQRREKPVTPNTVTGAPEREQRSPPRLHWLIQQIPTSRYTRHLSRTSARHTDQPVHTLPANRFAESSNWCPLVLKSILKTPTRAGENLICSVAIFRGPAASTFQPGLGPPETSSPWKTPTDIRQSATSNSWVVIPTLPSALTRQLPQTLPHQQRGSRSRAQRHCRYRTIHLRPEITRPHRSCSPTLASAPNSNPVALSARKQDSPE